MLATLPDLHLPTATAALTVDLRYPAAWFAPANPHARAVGARLHDWFRAIGVVADPAAAARLRHLDVAGYGGLPFALAGRDVLETVSAMLALWIFLDDAVEGHGWDDGGELLTALSGAPDLRGRDTPILRGYRDLGGRFLRMSAPWRQRHVADFGGWLLSVDDEAVLQRRFAAGARLSVEDHLAVREVNVGMIPVIDWLEYDLDAELPMDVHAHPAMATIVRAASRAVAFTNELYGYSKDRAAGWINAVACAEREHRVGPARAFAHVAALHDAAITDILAAEPDLLAAAGPDRPLVAAWLTRLHHVITGFAAWHARAPRYRADHTLDGLRLHLRLRAREWHT